MSRVEGVPESLLKYETPILVSSSFKSGSTAKSSKKQLAPLATQQARSEDYLNKILPPQEIVEKN